MTHQSSMDSARIYRLTSPNEKALGRHRRTLFDTRNFVEREREMLLLRTPGATITIEQAQRLDARGHMIDKEARVWTVLA
jgi:hypothetical protein